MGELVAIPDLRSVPPEPDAEIVRALEDLLEKARRGEVHSIGITSEGRDGYEIVWRGSRFKILGALAYLSHRIACYIESEESDGGAA